MPLLRFTDRDLLPLSAVEPCQRVRNARALDNRASVRPLLRKDCLPPLDTAIRRECRLRLLPVGDALFNAGESRLQRYEDSPRRQSRAILPIAVSPGTLKSLPLLVSLPARSSLGDKNFHFCSYHQ